MAYLTKKQEGERFLAEFCGAYVTHRQAHGSTCRSATCSRTPMLSALTNCRPLATPRLPATMPMTVKSQAGDMRLSERSVRPFSPHPSLQRLTAQQELAPICPRGFEDATPCSDNRLPWLVTASPPPYIISLAA